MRQQGRLTDWNDDRGFGFITPLGGEAPVFAHVSQFPRVQRRPMVTDLVTYVLDSDERGRPRAQDVNYLAPTRARGSRHVVSQQSYIAKPVAVVVLTFFALLAIGGVFARVAWVILAVDAVMSAMTLFAYRVDKVAAQQGRWRTQESTLHVMALLGGWPGALVAQRRYHHKTRKQPFQAIFWLTVIGNVLLLAWLTAASVLAMAPG